MFLDFLEGLLAQVMLDLAGVRSRRFLADSQLNEEVGPNKRHRRSAKKESTSRVLTIPNPASIIIRAACGRGGTGRRVRLRGVWETVWVQVPSTAPKKRLDDI